MDKKAIVARIDQLIIEKEITPYQLQNNADISSTIYQWRKNPVPKFHSRIHKALGQRCGSETYIQNSCIIPHNNFTIYFG